MLTKKKFRFSLFDFFLYIFMIIVVLLILLPMIHMLAVSFSSDVYVMQSKVGLWPKGFTAKTYGYVFEDDRIFRSYGNTILYTVLGTTISLSITAMGAYALSAKRMIGHKFFSMMIVFTMFFQGGMIPKVESCIEALLCGVHKVFILDGRVPHSILLEMLTDEGSGTMMVGEKK